LSDHLIAKRQAKQGGTIKGKKKSVIIQLRANKGVKGVREIVIVIFLCGSLWSSVNLCVISFVTQRATKDHRGPQRKTGGIRIMIDHHIIIR